MTLQGLLRIKDKCGGCKHQDKLTYGEECCGCVGSRGRMWTNVAIRDNYELDESLKVIEEKAAKFDMIQWAFDNGICFVWNGESRRVWLEESDLLDLERQYKEREKDGR